MKLRHYFLSLVALMLCLGLNAQSPYKFTTVKENKATSVKNQAKTGTCWCFATVSFLESELLRTGKGEFDLSEMFIVRNNYVERIQDNYLRQGKGNIGPGSIAHMATKVIDKYGIVPESVYSGINYDSPTHNHGEFTAYLESIAETSVKLKKRSPEYYKLQNAIMDLYLGEVPQKFNYNGKEYTPQTFRDYLGLNMSDYVEFTSFTNHPFYQRVPLEIPDNWDHELLYNLPLDEFMSVIDNAINTGYTVAWDGDIGDPGYIFAKYIAIIPEDATLTRDQILQMMDKDEIIPEKNITPEIRQEGYETFVTTDDHLEHIVGIAKDQNGTKYYNTKNSWGYGRRGNETGHHYLSESFVRSKTISIMVHKDAVPKEIKKKIGLK